MKRTVRLCLDLVVEDVPAEEAAEIAAEYGVPAIAGVKEFPAADVAALLTELPKFSSRLLAESDLVLQVAEARIVFAEYVGEGGVQAS